MKCVLFGVATLFLAESHLIGKPSPFPLECESRSSVSDYDSFEEGSSGRSFFSRFGDGYAVPGYRGRRYDYGNGYGNFYGNDYGNFYGFYGNGDGNIVGIDFENDSERSSGNSEIDFDFGRRRNFDGIYDFRYPNTYGYPSRYPNVYPGSGSYYPIN